MSKAVKIILDFILILIIIALCLYFALRYFDQILIYKVQTGSMEDDIHTGDYILIVKRDDYKVGDVVTFRKSDGFITHRIINKKGNTITTKGDANNVEDDKISKKDIVGKVIIAGGILNIIITYKYALVALFLSIYFFSCYFSKEKEEKEKI